MQKKNNILTYVFTFFLPIVILLIAYAIFGFYPFGQKSMLIMDMSGQYVNFYAGLKNMLNEGGILYSWYGSLGTNFSGTLAYYLISPFTLIPLLMPLEKITDAIMVMTLLKIATASLTFSLFAKKGLHTKNSTALLFSLCYGLMSYNIVYSMSLMWLDGIIFMPLILLGIQKMIEKKKLYGFFIFTISLALCFITSYYISYMVGIFAFIYLVTQFIIINKSESTSSSFKEFIKLFGKFIGATAIAFMISAVVNLPNAYSLLTGKLDDSTKAFPPFSWNVNILDFVSQFSFGSYTPITDDGLPNVFSSILVLMLTIGFFFNKKIAKKEKIVSLCVVAFLFVTFSISTTNVMWHLFQVPTWFPFRQSFILSFYMIYLSVKCFEKVEFVSKKVWIGQTVALSVIFILLKIFTNYVDHIFITIALLFIYCILLLSSKKLFQSNFNLTFKDMPTANKKIKLNGFLSVAIAIVLFVELCSNSVYIFTGLDNTFQYVNKDEFDNFYTQTKVAVDYVKEKDDSFYRMEKNFERSKNDSYLFGYKAISQYSSDYNRSLMHNLKSMGLAQSHFWTSNVGNTPLTNSIFSIKYLLSKEDLSNQYKKIDTINDINIYENEEVLPIAFCVKNSQQLSDSSNVFTTQNNYLNTMVGSDNNYFTTLPFETKRNINYVEYSLTAQNDGVIYFYAHSNNSCKISVTDQNGTRDLGVFDYQSAECNTLLGDYKKGETLTLKIDLSNNAKLYDVTFAQLDEKLLKDDLTKLKHSSLNITSFTNNNIKGNLTVNSDFPILYTSIPYDEGWTIKINGEKVENTIVYEDMLGCDLSKYNGDIQIELQFYPKGLKNGLIISLIGIGILVLIAILGLLISKKKNLKS